MMAESKGKRSRSHEGAWDSAFFRFAEGIRNLSHGAINYKIAYAMVGINGRYVNHSNAIVRKRTAAAFSRLIHSSRYAEDFRDAYGVDDTVFEVAADELLTGLRETSGLDDAELLDQVLELLRDGVCRGLENERLAGRHDVNPPRVQREMRALSAWCATSHATGRYPVRELMASAFHLMAFGCLDERFSRTLLAATPLVENGDALPEPEHARREDAACLIRVPDDRSAPVAGVWEVDASHPFSIGRYTDCDCIERDAYVSRLHVRIYWMDGAWYLEDAGSTHGTRVLRGDDASETQAVFDSSSADTATCRLAFGDRIELAGRVTYWFRSVERDEFDG